jgi:serine/threonine protein kinase
MIERFSKEIFIHSKLDHPNIVQLYGYYEENDNICLVLEYLSGGTLFDFQSSKGTFSVKEAATFLRDIINALIYLHDQHIAHRDLKPENIVLSSTGMAKLCDFGWSTVV